MARGREEGVGKVGEDIVGAVQLDVSVSVQRAKGEGLTWSFWPRESSNISMVTWSQLRLPSPRQQGLQSIRSEWADGHVPISAP